MSEDRLNELAQAATNVAEGRADGLDKTWMPDILELVSEIQHSRNGQDMSFINLGDAQPVINLGKLPGKNICLEFQYHTQENEALRKIFHEVCRQVVGWCNYHNMYLKAPLHKDFKAAHYFFQSGPSDTYFMIEFWTFDEAAIDRFVNLLRGRFMFNQPTSI